MVVGVLVGRMVVEVEVEVSLLFSLIVVLFCDFSHLFLNRLFHY